MKKFILLSVLFLSACSADTFIVSRGSMPAQSKIDSLEVGDSQYTVQNILGSPSNISSVDKNTWIYMKSQIKKIAFLEPKLLTRDILVIKFDKEGFVKSIDRADISDGKEIVIETQTTQVENVTEKGFFEEAFGKLNPNLAQ